jgi:hypothetical protein
MRQYQRPLSSRGAQGLKNHALEHVPKKLFDFLDENMLHVIDLERVLFPNATLHSGNAL